MTLSRLPYQIARCTLTGCNRPAMYIDTASPLRMCNFHAGLIRRGSAAAERMREKAKNFNSTLDALGELDEHGDLTNPHDPT